MAAGNAATLTVKILADISDFEKSLSKSERAFLKSADKVSDIGKKMSLGITLPFIAAAAALSKAAADDEASVAKLQRTFGTSTRTMETWITQLMKTVPATDDQIRGLTVSTDTLLRSMNMSGPAAMRMTQQVTQLAGDLAAYNHVELAVAQDALEKALAGKTRGLAEFGITVSEADIKNKAYAMGLARTGSELTHAQTAQASWALVLEKSKIQQGEAARTIGDNANAVARLKQSLDSASDSMGAIFLPTAAKVANATANMLNNFANTPPAMKSFLASVGAIAAAAGPAIFVLGSLTSKMTVLKAAMTDLGKVSLGTGMLKWLATGTLVAGLVVAPILAVANAFDKEGESVRRAAGDLDTYRTALSGLSAAQLKSQMSATQGLLQSIEARRRSVGAQLSGLPTAGTPGYDINSTPQQAKSLSAELNSIVSQQTAVRGGFDAIIAQLVAMNATAAGGGGESKSLSDQLKDIESRAQAVIQSSEQVKNGWAGIINIGHEQLAVVDQLNALLAKTSNALDPIAVKARDILMSLSGAGSASLNATIAKGLPGAYAASSSPVSVTAPFPGQAPTTWDMSHLFDLPATKLGEVSRAMTAGFQQVSVAIGDTLAQSLAVQFGGRGIGAQIGGGIGGAFGGGVGGVLGAAAGKGIGGLLGAGIGSVVPVVGTVVGTLIGGAIGGLFGHHKKAVDQSASAIDKMAAAADKATEALSGLPTGYKIAYARFLAAKPVTSTPSAPSDPGSPGGGSGGSGPTDGGTGGGGTTEGGTGNLIVHLHNPVFNGITDPSSFITRLDSLAQKHMARGGVGLRLAAAGL